MRYDMEDLFYKYGVDVVMAGHVHSYERMNPTYRNETDPCGPIYLNLGTQRHILIYIYVRLLYSLDRVFFLSQQNSCGKLIFYLCVSMSLFSA